MNPQQKKTFAVLLLAAAIYFALFIFPNLQGAGDPNMLAVFEIDEFAQYPHVIRMLTPGDTLYQSIRNFSVYLHYFYGYPFYFFSALALLPLRLILGGGWSANTPLIVAVLRQSINVLPMLAALMMLVFMQTRFRSWVRSLFLFMLLLVIPAVVVNNLWWHPDSLVFIFLVLTFFFLERDDFQFGRNFLLAAFACGLATGTKHLGLFFVLTVPVYLGWGVFRRAIGWRRALLMAAAFTAVMAAAVVISNPLLLLPIERGEIIATQRWQFQQTSSGIILAHPEPYFRWGEYPEDFRIHYGELYFIIMVLVALFLGIVDPRRRRLNVLFLTWMIPLTAVILSFATRRTHYFIPVALPVFSSLINLFPEGWLFSNRQDQRAGLLRFPWPGRAAAWLLGAAVGLQMALFVGTSVGIYRHYLDREQTAPSIAFYHKIEQEVLPQLSDQARVVYRDWKVYFPPRPGWRVEMHWDYLCYEVLETLDPDLILIERVNVALFGDPATVEMAANPAQMGALHRLYADVPQDQVAGYRLVYQDSFGYALVRDSVWQPR